jgi:hypothetical protein
MLAGCSEVVPPAKDAQRVNVKTASGKQHAVSHNVSKEKHPTLKMKWRHEAFVPKKPEIFTEKSVDQIKPCPTATYKCLSDFNNPSESKVYLKTGDRRAGWHDARAGSLSPSCELGMNKSGGFNPTLSVSI